MDLLAVGIDATQGVSGANQFNAALDSMARKADDALGDIRSSLNRVTADIFNLRNVLAAVGFEQTVKSIMTASMQFDRISNILQSVSATSRGAAAEMQFLRNESERLGVSLPVAATQFALLKAATVGTALEGSKLRYVFSAIVTESAGLHLSAEKTEAALYAVQHMMSKGTVQSMDLRRQLGNALPDAFVLFARASGLSMEKFNQALRAGQIRTADILPKVAELMVQKYEAAALVAANLTQGLLNKMSSALFELKGWIAHNGLGEVVNDSLREVIALLKSNDLKEAAREVGQVLAKGVTLAANAMIFLGKHAHEVLMIFGLYAGLKVTFFFQDLYKSITSATKALIALEAVQGAMGFLGMKTTSKAPIAANSWNDFVQSNLATAKSETGDHSAAMALLGSQWKAQKAGAAVVEVAPTTTLTSLLTNFFAPIGASYGAAWTANAPGANAAKDTMVSAIPDRFSYLTKVGPGAPTSGMLGNAQVKADLEALNLVVGKNGVLLSENAMKSRLAGAGYAAMSKEARASVAAFAQGGAFQTGATMLERLSLSAAGASSSLRGLVQAGAAGAMTALSNSWGAVATGSQAAVIGIKNFAVESFEAATMSGSLTLALSNSVSWLKQLGGAVVGGSLTLLRTAAVGAGNAIVGVGIALKGLIFGIPVWGWILAAVVAVTTALYANRNAMVTINGHTAQLKDYMASAWGEAKKRIGETWDGLKAFANWMGSGFSKIWSDIAPGIHFFLDPFMKFMDKFAWFHNMVQNAKTPPGWVNDWAVDAERRHNDDQIDVTRDWLSTHHKSFGTTTSGNPMYAATSHADWSHPDFDPDVDYGKDDNGDLKGKRDGAREYLDQLKAEIDANRKIADLLFVQKTTVAEITAIEQVNKKVAELEQGKSPNDIAHIESLKPQMIRDQTAANWSDIQKASNIEYSKTMEKAQGDDKYLKVQLDFLAGLTSSGKGYKEVLVQLAAAQYAFNEMLKIDPKSLDPAKYAAMSAALQKEFLDKKDLADREKGMGDWFNGIGEARIQLADLHKEYDDVMASRGGKKTGENSALIQDQANLFADKKATPEILLWASKLPDGTAKLKEFHDAYVDIFKEEHKIKAAEELEKFADQVKASIGGTEELTKKFKDLGKATAAGWLNGAEYQRALQEWTKQYDLAIDKQLSGSQRWQDGVILAMREIQRASGTAAEEMSKAFTNVFNGLENQLIKFLDTGKFKLSAFTKALRHEVDTMVVKQSMSALTQFALGSQGNNASPQGKSSQTWLGTILGATGMGGKGKTPLGVRGDPIHVVNDDIAAHLSSSALSGRGASGITGGASSMGGSGGINSVFGSDATADQNFDTTDPTKQKGFWQMMRSGGIAPFFAAGSNGKGGLGSVLTAGIEGFMREAIKLGAFSSIPKPSAAMTDSLMNAGGNSSGLPSFADGTDGLSPVPSPFDSLIPPGDASFANGGIMTSRGSLSLQRYSNGGVANRPQLAMFGEGRKPEAYVPLPDGKTIPVTMNGSQGGMNVTLQSQTHIYDQTGSGVGVKSESKLDAGNLVTQIFISDLSQEGPISKGLRAYTGA